MDATGFGTVTMDLGRALLDRGLDVRFVSQNAYENLPEPFGSRTVDTASMLTEVQGGGFAAPDPAKLGVRAAEFIPNLLTGDTEDMFAASGAAWGSWRPEACILLGDFGAIRLFMPPYKQHFARIPTYHYVPIEGVDLPPLWKGLWDIAKPVAVSEFGADEIAKVVGYRPPVAYHGVDAVTFHPPSARHPHLIAQKDAEGKHEGTWTKIESKAAAKAFFGFHPKLKMVLRTDSHWPRKNQNALARAMLPVLQKHKDTVMVWHCDPLGPGGFLPDTISKLAPQLPNKEQMQITGLGKLPRDVLALLMVAADLYVSCSAEGFGLTIAEAIASGVPAVGLDYSAVPEVIGPAGVVVPIDSLTDNEYDHFWARPDEAELTKAVDWLLSHPKRAREIGALGPKHVRDTFTWEKAADVFMRVLGVDR